MPKDFDKCVDEGGRVRRVSGPDKDHGLKEGEYVTYCYPKSGGPGIRGEVKKKKEEK